MGGFYVTAQQILEESIKMIDGELNKTMKHLKFKPPMPDPRLDYMDDIEKLLGILESRGFTSTPDDIARAWEAHSESYAAGWLILYAEDKHNFDSIMYYMEQV